MKSEIKTEFQVTLSLNVDEAEYLKGLTQNPLDEETEDPQHRKIRKALFDALPSFAYLSDVKNRVLPVQDHFPVLDQEIHAKPVRRVLPKADHPLDLT